MNPRGIGRPSPTDRRRALTIVELLVVVGVIVLLVGITMTVGTAVAERAEVSQTRRTMDLLDATVDAWQTDARRNVTWGRDGDPPGATYDMQAETDEIFVITELLDVLLRSDEAMAVFSRIDPRYIHRYEAGVYPEWIVTAAQRNALDDRFADSVTILDAWDTPIYALHPGRESRDTDDEYRRDDDGTYRTDRELKYGVARNRRIAFVAAGPSGRFGSVTGDSYPGIEGDQDDLADNIYSYPLKLDLDHDDDPHSY